MTMQIVPMSEDLRRQRRNLLIVSFILVFMKYGGINISKTTLLGTEIQFSNTSAIFLGLWLLWLYFSVRYYQYFMQEGFPQIKSSRNDLLTERCRSKIRSIIKSKHPDSWDNTQSYDYNILKKNWKTIFFQAQEPDPKSHESHAGKEFKMEISLWGLWKEIFGSWITLVFNSSVISDYIFPIILAVFTFIYCNLGNWSGSFLNLFS